MGKGTDYIIIGGEPLYLESLNLYTFVLEALTTTEATMVASAGAGTEVEVAPVSYSADPLNAVTEVVVYDVGEAILTSGFEEGQSLDGDLLLSQSAASALITANTGSITVGLSNESIAFEPNRRSLTLRLLDGGQGDRTGGNVSTSSWEQVIDEGIVQTFDYYPDPDEIFMTITDWDGDYVLDGYDKCPLDNPGDLDSNGDGCVDDADTLANAIIEMDLFQGTEKSLLAKIKDQGGTLTAKVNSLCALVNEAQAQMGNGNLTEAQYLEIVDIVRVLIGVYGGDPDQCSY
jgi:hypothetical protein